MKSSLGHRGHRGIIDRPRPLRILLVGLQIMAISTLATASLHATEWHRETVDGSIGGRFSSLRVDKYGNAHVCSFSSDQNMLSYAFWDSAIHKWFTTYLDRSSGFCSLILDSHEHPHISSLEYGTGKLKYLYWDGTSWNKEALQIQARIIAYNTSITLDSKDNPIISFYEEVGAGLDKIRLRVVARNNRLWELRTVDADEGSGKFNSIGIDSAGNPEIAYGNVEYKNASLRFARWNGHAWDIEILEGAGRPGTSMWSVGLLVDKADLPHIAYTDVANRLVKYAVKKNGRWDVQVVDSLAKVGYPDRNGIATDSQGNIYISYYDAGAGVLKLAHMKDHKWASEVVDQNFNGFTSCLRIYGDTIWITYSDDTGEELRIARRSLDPGSEMSR